MRARCNEKFVLFTFFYIASINYILYITYKAAVEVYCRETRGEHVGVARNLSAVAGYVTRDVTCRRLFFFNRSTAAAARRKEGSHANRLTALSQQSSYTLIISPLLCCPCLLRIYLRTYRHNTRFKVVANFFIFIFFIIIYFHVAIENYI